MDEKNKIVAGTQNEHKIIEILNSLTIEGIEIKTLNNYGSIPDVEEDGSSFEENALLKAEAYRKLVKLAVFADDSGICVDALNGMPGVYSARYAGENVTYLDNNKLLLQEMADVPDDQRSAQFITTICYLDENGPKYFTGITEGVITREFRGENGFGYDPVFYLPDIGKSYAELTLEEKNRISHRGKALAKFKAFLEKNFAI
jgi:XTP/dITP diphosphohydrolase